jgi:hypothetical protein
MECNATAPKSQYSTKMLSLLVSCEKWGTSSSLFLRTAPFSNHTPSLSLSFLPRASAPITARLHCNPVGLAWPHPHHDRAPPCRSSPWSGPAASSSTRDTTSPPPCLSASSGRPRATVGAMELGTSASPPVGSCRVGPTRPPLVEPCMAGSSMPMLVGLHAKGPTHHASSSSPAMVAMAIFSVVCVW